jgi:hypothetical protein
VCLYNTANNQTKIFLMVQIMSVTNFTRVHCYCATNPNGYLFWIWLCADFCCPSLFHAYRDLDKHLLLATIRIRTWFLLLEQDYMLVLSSAVSFHTRYQAHPLVSFVEIRKVTHSSNFQIHSLQRFTLYHINSDNTLL